MYWINTSPKMSQDQFRFNVFSATVVPEAWTDFTCLRRRGLPDKGIRIETARLWRAGTISAECSDDSESWILCRAQLAPDLTPYGYFEVSIEKVPAAVLLNFYLLTRSSSPGGKPVFREPTKKYWEASRNKAGNLIYCLRPSFSAWGDLITVDVAATGMKIVPAGFNSKKTLQVFLEKSPGYFESAGYRFPTAGEIVKDPPVKGAKVRIPWTPRESGAGPLSSKIDFLHWLIEEINASGVAKLTPYAVESEPAKNRLGARGQDAKLAKAKLVQAIFDAVPEKTIHLYDRRTEIGNQAQWSQLAGLIGEAANRLGFAVTDRGMGDYLETDCPVLVAIDQEDLFESDEDDTKPAAVASFPRPVQCFSTDIVAPGKDESYEIPAATLLVMLANQVAKQEVANRRLLMPREWLLSSTLGSSRDYVFCDQFEDGEDFRFIGIHVESDGTIEFIERPTRAKLYDTVIDRQLTPVFRVQQSVPAVPDDFVGAVELKTTSIKALPLSVRDGMTAHFSGVRIVGDWGCYYAAGAERPNGLKVERALVLRQVRKIGDARGSGDLEMMAGFCVDPTIRVHAATVWPAPYKLLNEYVQYSSSTNTCLYA